MCEKAHGGSIFAECRNLIRMELGRLNIPNKEMRLVLKRHGGCMNGKNPLQPIDTVKEKVLVSNR